MAKELQQENESLRSQLEEYRQRELSDLRQRLSEAETSKEHYRNEAARNADLGREIAMSYQAQITELKTKLQAYEQLSNGRNTRNNSRA